MHGHLPRSFRSCLSDGTTGRFSASICTTSKRRVRGEGSHRQLNHHHSSHDLNQESHKHDDDDDDDDVSHFMKHFRVWKPSTLNPKLMKFMDHVSTGTAASLKKM